MADPRRLCLQCGAAFNGRGSYCAEHSRGNPQYNDPRYRRARALAVKEHVEQAGYICPGYERARHPATRRLNPLTADHVDPLAAGGAVEGPLRVYCRACNSRRGARLRRRRR